MSTKPHIKILCIGDNHIDDQRPVNRKDNYLEATLDELRESFEIAIAEKVDAALLLGDLFNRLEPEGEARNGVLQLLKWAKEQGLRVICVIGNHDIAHNPANYTRSALYSCELNGLLEIPRSERDIYGEVPELGLGVVHFTPTAHEELAKGLLAKRTMTLQAAHTSVTLGAFNYLKHYVILEDIKLSSSCKILVTGHIHTPYRATRKDGVEFINPGSTCRKAFTTENRTRRPFVVLVEYELGGDLINTTDIPLVRPKDADEIFYSERALAKKDYKEVKAKKVLELTEMSGWDDEDEDRETSLHSSGTLKNVSEAAIKLGVETWQKIYAKGK